MRNALIVLFAIMMAAPAMAAMTDVQVARAIIRDSVAQYPGPCACPYNVDRRGHSCGRRSAYSRPGGYAPICYPSDVTPAMISEFRRQHR